MIMKRYITALLFLPALFVALPSHSETIVNTAGNLRSAVEENNLSNATELVISGTINARDFFALPYICPNLRNVDISQAKIMNCVVPSQNGAPRRPYPADKLPDAAFAGSLVEEVKLPLSLTEIGDGAFAATPLRSVVLHEGITEIGNFVFSSCTSLESVTLPASLKSLGTHVFSGCTALESADLSAVRLKAIPDATFKNCAALQTLKLPKVLESVGVRSFAGTTSLQFVFPETLKHIGEQAFIGSGLKQADLPQSIVSVGDYAFALSAELVHASAPEGVDFGEGVFFKCPKLSSDALNLTTIPALFFAGSDKFSLSSSKLDGVSKIEAYSLADTGSSVIDMGKNLWYIGDHALDGAVALKKIDASALGSNPPVLGEDVFKGITQSDVTLLVMTPEDAEVWRATPQWSEFNIIDITSDVKEIQDSYSVENSVRVWFEGKELMLSASQEISHIILFTSAGLKVAESAPYAMETSVDTSALDEHIYILDVTMRSGAVRKFKLMR